jgi:hypothetical protein
VIRVRWCRSVIACKAVMRCLSRSATELLRKEGTAEMLDNLTAYLVDAVS